MDRGTTTRTNPQSYHPIARGLVPWGGVLGFVGCVSTQHYSHLLPSSACKPPRIFCSPRRM